MSRINRRTFLRRSIATAGAACAIASPFRRILGANETIRVGVAGIHGQGGSHIGALQKMEGVEVTYLIDPDSGLFDRRTKQVQELGGGKPTCVQDVRRALEDKELDAISIASCNHWHCLLTIWACQAGKDVYVEKPLSHDLHEGRIALETSRKHARVVQYGTGSGSLGDGIAALARKGTYGKLLVSRGLCYKRRGSIGFREPGDPPPALDFDIWTGPAPRQPYHGNLVHYNWHWFWDFGGGDIANQGSHQMHAALHAIPDASLPRNVITVGGRFGYRDQGETANTQISVYDFGETQLIFEVRGLETPSYFGQGTGNTFHFEEGVVAGGKFLPGGKGEPQPVESARAERVSRGGNFGEFIRCMRTRERDLLDWNLETAHFSAGLCHLGNISYRLGEEVAFSDRRKPFGDDAAANETFERMADHLGERGLKLEETTYRLGRRLELDPRAERIVGDAEADAMLRRPGRPPFAVPEKAI